MAADETKQSLLVEGFEKLAHTEDLTSLGLPRIPKEGVLWWNADYVLFAARQKLPRFDYYVMLEYDVFLNCDVDAIVAKCVADGVDLVVHQPSAMPAGTHWSSDSISEFSDDPIHGLIPFIVVSDAALDLLFRRRLALASLLWEGSIKQWPYCEMFIPTCVAREGGLVIAALEHFVDTELFRFRPFLTSRDPRLGRLNSMAHPVFTGARFVRAYLSTVPNGPHLTSDGLLREELRREDPADLRLIFGDIVPETEVTGGICLPEQEDTLHFLVDVARNKPAIQSSVSEWSVGANAVEDACRAVSGPLPDDMAFHTDVENEPWWQVDLLEACDVSAVEIINRPGIEERFSRFRVDVSVDNVLWSTQFEKNDDALVSSDPFRPATFSFEHAIRARYVRIVQSGYGVFHLRRIRVLGMRSECQELPFVEQNRQVAPPPVAEAPPQGQALAATIVATFNQMFGRSYDSFDLDKLEILAASIDSKLYAAASMGGVARLAHLYSLLDLAVSALTATGLILEFGVFSGGTINHLARQLPNRRLYGFDSFEGLPESWRPGFEQGTFRRADLPDVETNVELVVGWFDQTLPRFMAANPVASISLLHVDCDLYSSTKTIFQFAADRIIPGTIIVFDEYFNYPDWRQHEFKAFAELCAERRMTYSYIGYVPSHQQVAVKITSVG